ncbi:formyltransferase family protein [Natronorarus salvus]|uniref:formyltransferase family protein n=1 Tax=Natronorarus salvus TaxID=3117733 RepID=UPI002F26DC7C
MSNRPTKLCVLAEPYLRDFEIQSIETAVEEINVEIPLVLVNEVGQSGIDPELKANVVNNKVSLDALRLFIKLLEVHGAWTFVFAEKTITEQLGVGEHPIVHEDVNEISCFSEAVIRHVTPIRDGNWMELPPEAVDLVRENCDIVVRYGFGLLRGEILRATEYGVLSFHPADIRQYRGLGVPKAWLDGKDVMGMTLQRLSEEIDGGEIVAYQETDVSDCATLWEVYEELRLLQTELLAEGIRNLADPTVEITTPESLGPYYPTTSRRTLSFAGRTLSKNMVGRVKNRIG